MLLLSALCCSRPPFQEEQSEPSAKHKGYPWSKVTCTMMASFFLSFFLSFFFFFGAALERNTLLASFFDWERKRLGSQRKNINRRASAVILSIKGCLGGWCQVAICQRETGWHRHCLTLQYGRHTHKIEKLSSLPGISIVLQLHSFLMAFRPLSFCFSVSLFDVWTCLKASVSRILWGPKIKIRQSSRLCSLPFITEVAHVHIMYCVNFDVESDDIQSMILISKLVWKSVTCVAVKKIRSASLHFLPLNLHSVILTPWR